MPAALTFWHTSWVRASIWVAEVTLVLFEKELGKASYALHYTTAARPSNILLAGTPEQRERYLLPCVRGERIECLVQFFSLRDGEIAGVHHPVVLPLQKSLPRGLRQKRE